MKRNYIKNDIIFIAAALLITILGFCVMQVMKKDGSTVIITVDGSEYASVPLNADRTIDVSGEYGSNRVVISDGMVYMEYADCPDSVCVKTGKISKVGETIVCLPHKLIVEVAGEVMDVDGMVQ